MHHTDDNKIVGEQGTHPIASQIQHILDFLLVTLEGIHEVGHKLCILQRNFQQV